MNICFIGLGSIAERHIKNLKDMLEDNVSIDVLRSGKGKSVTQNLLSLIDNIYFEDEDLKKQYDAIFITNPTAFHYETLKKYNMLSDAFFVEKPVFLNGKENLAIFQDIKKIYYVACPLRYTKVIQYLKKHVDFSTIHSMRCISSSYLPEWRPGTDYRKSYSAIKDMGGGVSIDLIHEWDFLCYLTGKPDKGYNLISKKSSLELNTDDIAIYIAEYADKTVELHLDYFGRHPIRRIELFGEEDTISADLIAQEISYLKNGKVVNLWENRNDYHKRELACFLKMVNRESDCTHGLNEACEMLRLAKGEI